MVSPFLFFVILDPAVVGLRPAPTPHVKAVCPLQDLADVELTPAIDGTPFLSRAHDRFTTYANTPIIVIC